MDAMINPILLSKLNQPGAAVAPGKSEKACENFEALFMGSLFSEISNGMQGISAAGTDKIQEQWVWGLMFQNLAQELAKSDTSGLKKELCQQVFKQAKEALAPADAAGQTGPLSQPGKVSQGRE